MFDCIVVGSGFAGSVSARLLAEQGKKVLIIEKRKHIAGNCYDKVDENGILVHMYGPHLFHTDNKLVWDFLSRFTTWEIYHHKVKAHIDGTYAVLPFNFTTIEQLFPKKLAIKLQEKLLLQYTINTKVPIMELLKSDDEDLKFLAKFIYEKVFVNYTAKQWGLKPEELDSAVTARVPVFIGKDDRYFNDIYQGVPAKGYTKLFENMLNHQNIKLMLNTDFKEICEIKENKLYFLGQPFNAQVVYSGEIDLLFDYKYGNLPYRSVEMQFETIEKKKFQKSATINYPNEYEFTRITEFKHIHPSKSKKTTILKEIPQAHVRGKNTPYYPIFTESNQQKYEQYKSDAKKIPNLILLGRLAEYKYYDMDDIVTMALDVFKDNVE